MPNFSCLIVVILLVILGDGIYCQNDPVSPPNGVSFPSVSAKSITVRWNATIDHTVYVYQVFYKKKASGDNWNVKTVGNTTTEVQIEGLKPFTYYVIQILVNTTSGISNTSDAVEVRTGEDLPNAPSNLKASFTSLSNLQISWLLLSFDQANGIVHGYHYIVYNPQNEVIVNRTVSNTTHSVNITNIKACTGYVAQVKAWTGAGEGNYSTLNISNPCEPPRIIHFEKLVLAALNSYFFVIPCNYTGFPKPSVAWILNDGMKVESGFAQQHTIILPGGTTGLKKTKTVYENGSLVINFVEAADKGNYHCVVNQMFGSAMANTTLIVTGGTVTVRFELQLVNEEYDEELKNKDSARYKALSSKILKAVGEMYNNTEHYKIKKIKIDLFRNGSVIVMFSISATFDSALNEKAVTADIVDIMVTNVKDGKLGSLAVGNLTVYGAPPPPTNLNVVLLRPTYVKLQWKPPKHDDVYEVDKYSMQYRKHGEKTFKSVKTVKNSGSVISDVLDGLKADERYVVRIMSHRKGGDDSKDSQGITREIVTPGSQLKVILLAIVLPIILAILIVIVICCVRNLRKEPAEENHLAVRYSRPLRAEENLYDIGRLLEEFPCKWKEIPRSDITVGKELGSGAFGAVLRAELRLNDKVIPCAIKKLKDFATEREHRDLFNELSIMAQVGYHPHVISLLGACTVNGPLWVVVKLAENGCLLEFLHSHRKPDYIDHSYQNVAAGTSSANELEELDKLQKLKFAYGIAKGMSHLEKLKCVHRDLAARNVLLGKNLVPMVSDFGLSRDIYESGMYEDVRGGKRPVRWMAPESIEDYTCTTKSDVWSFGVTLWEIETAGTIPYAGVDSGMDILNEVKKGYRLEKPKDCDDDVYELMLSTWRINPLHRPTFVDLTGTVEEMLTGIAEYLELQPEDEYQEVFLSAYDEVEINTTDLEDSDMPVVVNLPNGNYANNNQAPIQYATTGKAEHLELQPEDKSQEVFSNAYDEIKINLEDGDIPSVVNLPNGNKRPNKSGINQAPIQYATLDLKSTADETRF